MIRSLRRKFILIAMLSLVGTMVLLCAAIGVGNHRLTASRADRAIALLYQNGGRFPDPDPAADPAAPFDFQVTQETPFETRYFIVELSPLREVRGVDLEHIAALDRQTVVECINDVLASGKERGYADYYRFGVFREEDGGSTIIGLDCFLQLQAANNVVRVTALVSLAGAGMVLVLLIFFSGKAIRPFAENLERQRRFVTDASHELKTPLAILSADLGLLEGGVEEERWLKSAQDQVERLDRLIGNLVELARSEETVGEEAMALFSLSDVVRANADAFQPLAAGAGKTLKADIAPGVELRGVRDDLFRLCAILLDNGVKYCDPGGEIALKLGRRGRTACLTLSNPCAGADPAQVPRYFDRFYRADASRARSTGGCGIGLSTAKAIVVRHRGRIACRCAGGTVTFTVLLPQNLRGERGRKRETSNNQKEKEKG